MSLESAHSRNFWLVTCAQAVRDVRLAIDDALEAFAAAQSTKMPPAVEELVEAVVRLLSAQEDPRRHLAAEVRQSASRRPVRSGSEWSDSVG